MWGKVGDRDAALALILPDTGLAQAQSLAERLWKKVQAHRFIHHNAVISMTISLGVAGTDTPDVTCQDGLVCAADAALYHGMAKGTGRNRYVVAPGGQVFHCSQDAPPLSHDIALSHHWVAAFFSVKHYNARVVAWLSFSHHGR